jgi:small subunit ribosomal protein S6
MAIKSYRKRIVARETSSKVIKEVSERLRDYELALVFSPELAEDGLEASMEKVNQFITERHGTMGEVDKWGKKRLAYPISHFVEGNYVVARFQMSPKFTAELEANLQISEDILRYLLTRVNS